MVNNTVTRFFFAPYGCCILTETYAWLLIVLFIFATSIFMFCILTTSTIRWLYKRRMKKKLQELKKKFVIEERIINLRDAKLTQQTIKNQNVPMITAPSPPVYLPIDDKKQNIAILLDPSKRSAKSMKKRKSARTPKQSKKRDKRKDKKGKENNVIYDEESTPVAQSTLASESKLRIQPVASPIAPSPLPPQQQYQQQPQIVQQQQPPQQQQQPYPPHQLSIRKPVDIPVAPPKMEPKPDVAPQKSKSVRLSMAPPALLPPVPPPNVNVSSTATSTGPPPTSSPYTTQSPADELLFNDNHNINNNNNNNKKQASGKLDSAILSDGESVKNREAGRGGKSEWRHYNMNEYTSSLNNKPTKDKHDPSTSRSSFFSTTSYRPNSRAWLYDSTGSSNDVQQQSYDTNVDGQSSSILKTDSWYYKTASSSTSKYPHGVFTFDR